MEKRGRIITAEGKGRLVIRDLEGNVIPFDNDGRLLEKTSPYSVVIWLNNNKWVTLGSSKKEEYQNIINEIEKICTTKSKIDITTKNIVKLLVKKTELLTGWEEYQNNIDKKYQIFKNKDDFITYQLRRIPVVLGYVCKFLIDSKKVNTDKLLSIENNISTAWLEGYNVQCCSKEYRKAPSNTIDMIRMFSGGRPDKAFDTIDGKAYFWIDSNTPTKRKSIQSEIKGDDIDKVINNHYGTPGLKVMYGAIFKCSENHDTGHFIYNENEFLDLLGYKRQSNGSHESRNRKRVAEILDFFLNKLIYRVEVKNKNKDVLCVDDNILYATTKYTAKKKGKTIWNGQKISFNENLWNEIVRKHKPKYFLFSEKFLKLNAERRKYSIITYPYICNLWVMNGKSATRTISVIAKELGLTRLMDDKNYNRSRERKRFIAELNTMVSDGLIGDVLTDGEKLTFIMPENHGLINLSKIWKNKHIEGLKKQKK